MARMVEKSETFHGDFPAGITMELRRLEPWHWGAVQIRAQRSAAALREGGSALIRYGFDSEEFDALADPASWDGVAEFFYAVELGMTAIVSWTGVRRDGEMTDAPVQFPVVARLMRIASIRKRFLDLMVAEGNRLVIADDEGNV